MNHKLPRRLTSIFLALVFAFAGFQPAMAAPPANDNFADADVIEALPLSVTVDTTEAGVEPGEFPYDICAVGERTVWYSFAPAESMTVKLDTQGSAISNALVILYRVDGPGFAGLSLQKCAYATNPPVDVHLDAGQLYYLQVSSFNGEFGNVQLNFEQIPSPTNDNFGSAEVVNSVPFGATVDLISAWSEPGEPQPCYGMDRTVWYSFTPAEDMLVQVDMQGSSIYNTNVNIYRSIGSEISELEFLVCSIFSPGSTVFLAQAGERYLLQAGTVFGDVGTIQLNLRQIFAPENDNFADAHVISALPFSATLDTSGAGLEPGEPQSPCVEVNKTAWYRFSPAEDMVVIFDAQGSTSSGANIAIYLSTGPAFSDLQFLVCAGFSGDVLSMEAGEDYYIQAGTALGWAGSIQINLIQTQAPGNDDFASATAIPSTLPFDDTPDTKAASTEIGEPVPTCAYDGQISNTVWYVLTPSSNGSFSVYADYLYFAPVYAVYTGSSLDNLTPLGCDSFGNRLSFEGSVGNSYYIQVGNRFPWEQGGPLGFHVDVPPPPAADFGYYINNPSRFDTIQFYDNSYDPANLGFESFTWDFGDGTTSTDPYPTHRYASDGDYTVEHSVTTVDGRTAATSQVVQVRTHDVTVMSVTAPETARVGRSGRITVSIVNTSGYTETVTVHLYRSVAGGGFEWIGDLTKSVPTTLDDELVTRYTFNYTFTTGDAEFGKVIFRAEATIDNAPDAFPQDNLQLSGLTWVRR